MPALEQSQLTGLRISPGICLREPVRDFTAHCPILLRLPPPLSECLCQSRRPTVLLSSSMNRIGPKFAKYKVVSSGKFVMSWIDAIRLVAVVPGYRGDAAVFDSAPHFHLTGNHIILAGSQMFVPRNAGPFRAIYKNCPMTCLLCCPKQLQPDPRKPLNPRFLRGMNVNILKPFVIDRVTLCLVAGHLLPPGLWLKTTMLRGWIRVKNNDVTGTMMWPRGYRSFATVRALTAPLGRSWWFPQLYRPPAQGV